MDAATATDHPRSCLTDPAHRRQAVGGVTKGAQDLLGLELHVLLGGGQRVDLRQVQLPQEAVVRHHPAVHRGDDLRTAGVQASGGAIGQPLGIGFIGDERREDPVSQYGVLAGLSSKPFNGLSGTMGKADLCATVAPTVPLFHELRVPRRGMENFSRGHRGPFFSHFQ